VNGLSTFFEAKASDFRVATQRIDRSAACPSHVVIPVVEK
jgi:hypothetical protein